MVTNDYAVNFLDQVESVFGQLQSNNQYPEFVSTSFQEISVLIIQLKEFFKEQSNNDPANGQPQSEPEEISKEESKEKFDKNLLRKKRENVSDSSSFTIVNDPITINDVSN